LVTRGDNFYVERGCWYGGPVSGNRWNFILTDTARREDIGIDCAGRNLPIDEIEALTAARVVNTKRIYGG
jgi:hypothetical protein